MISAPETNPAPVLQAQCKCSIGSFPVDVRQITPDGCIATTDAEWASDFDFLSLHLPGQVAVNGQIVDRDGKSAQIRFFGQIHPQVVAGWTGQAA